MDYRQPKFNPNHPFKLGIRSIISQHFAPSIAERFGLILEVEEFHLDPKRTPNLINQKRDEKYVCEVYYTKPDSLSVYVCDVCSWWSRSEVEACLLRYITDKVKTGAFGQDWAEDNGRISLAISSGKFETPDEEITNYMVPTKSSTKEVKK